MLEKRFLMLTALILGTCFSAATSFSQNPNKTPEIPDTKSGLRLSTKLDREVCKLKDDPVLKITLTNVGTSPIALYKKMYWGYSASLTLIVRDASGKTVEPDTIYDAKDRPPFRIEDFKTIQPGESFEVDKAISLRNEGVVEAGAYKFTLFYQSPVLQSDAPEIPGVWVTENGPLKSKSVTLQVIK